MAWTCEVLIDDDKDRVGAVVATFDNGAGQTFTYSRRVDANISGDVTTFVAEAKAALATAGQRITRQNNAAASIAALLNA